jgi:hypothetical protein
METSDREQIEAIQQRLGVLDEKYASTIYVFSRIFKRHPDEILNVFEERGIPREIPDLSDIPGKNYCGAVRELERQDDLIYACENGVNNLLGFRKLSHYLELIEHLEAHR